jgi:hypothetical protein
MTESFSMPNYVVATAERQFAAMQSAISGWRKEVLNDDNRRFFENRLKIPIALVDHLDSDSWIAVWDYLDQRSYGDLRKKEIVDLINRNSLDKLSPDEFLRN